MKNYNRSFYRPNTGYLRFKDYQIIDVQGKSPIIGGSPVLRPNLLEYKRASASYVDIDTYQYGKLYRQMTSQFGEVDIFSFAVSQSDYTRIRQLAVNKCLQEVAGIRTNALELYATRIETINTVSKRIGQIANAMLALKRGRWKQFKRHLGLDKSLKRPGAHKFQDIPGLWLEYSFGWSPLVSDCYNILNKTFEPPRMKVQKEHSEVIDKSFDQTSASRVRLTGSCRVNVRATASCMVSVDVPALAALAQYGINNPAAVAWELVPWSFVVDWFIPVGDYIEQLGATAGLLLTEQQVTVTQNLLMGYQLDITKWLQFAGETSPTPVTFVAQSGKYKKRDLQPFTYKMIVEDPLDQSIRRVSYALSLLSLAFTGKRSK